MFGVPVTDNLLETKYKDATRPPPPPPLIPVFFQTMQSVNQLRTGEYHVLMAQLFNEIKSTIVKVTIWNRLLELL